MEQTRWNNYDIVIWDEGGQQKLQPLYRHYYPGSKAIIFVVDSWDKNRMDQAKIELHKLLCKPELKDVIVLILANKQDQPNALSGDQVQDGLGMTYYVSQSPELLKSLAAETLLKMLPDDVIEIVSSYTPHRLCRPWNKYVGVGTQTKCAVFETSATAKTGLNEGLEWLATQLDNSKQNNCIIL